jgi:hypothetical protein
MGLNGRQGWLDASANLAKPEKSPDFKTGHTAKVLHD